MKGIVVTPDGKMFVKDFGEPLYKTVGETVGGPIEHVKPRGLKAPYCMIVNEEGLYLDLMLNPAGSYLYETHKHGHPIVGTVVFMKDGCGNGGPDIFGLEPNEEAELLAILTPMLRNLSER